MPNIIGAKFKEGGKVYNFECNNLQLKVGDGVIVETSRGIEYAVVAVENTQISQKEVIGELKPVVRKATPKDTEQYNKLQEKKVNAMEEARKSIQKFNLPMKLVDCEWAFEGNKATFFFSADDRVDFREMVRDLAGKLRVRIELRQIGIRDECKMKGGLGPCGRACCCSSYLKDFEHVTIKMAKNQGLSLNPTQISGLCGRLMCCLKFENDYYQETLKLMPKVGKEIDTPDGKAMVESADILRRTIKARVTLPNGDIEIKQYHIDQLKVDTTEQSQTETTEDDTDIAVLDLE